MPLAALAAAGIGGSIIGAFGANSAAGKQADAANNAANLQFQASNNALNFEKSQYNNSLQFLQPYYNTGVGALDMLRNGLGIPGQAPNNFQFPGSAPQPTLPNLSGAGIDRLGLLRGENPRGGPQPIQATAMGATVPRTAAQTPLANPGQTATMPGSNIVNGNLSGEAGTPGGPINSAGGTNVTNANNGTLVVPSSGAGGGTSASGSPNIGFGSLLESYPGGPFVAPTGVTEQNDPGYQFRLKTGLDSLTNSAAARGGLLTGGTAKGLEDFAQNDASNEYGNVYNRALNTYGTNYNQFVNDQTNQFNKLAAISGMGQTSANNLSTAGVNTANQVGSNLLGTANAVGNDLQNAGAARASGITGVTNSINGGISNLSQLALLQQMGLIG